MYKIPGITEHDILCLEPRMQSVPGPDHVGPYKARLTFGLHPDDPEQL